MAIQNAFRHDPLLIMNAVIIGPRWGEAMMPVDQMLILRLGRVSHRFGRHDVGTAQRSRNVRILVKEEQVLDDHQAALDWSDQMRSSNGV